MIDNAHRRAIAGHVSGQIGDLDRRCAVFEHRTAKNAVSGVRITKVEATFNLSLGPVAEHVGFGAVPQVNTEIAENLEIVGDLRRAPDLGRRLAHTGVTGIDQVLGVGSLDAAAGRIGFLEFETDIAETGVAEPESGVAGDRQRIAVAFEVAAPLGVKGEARIVFLEHEIHDAGDGVGTVLRRGAVAQHFEPVQRDGRNDRQVGALGTAGDARSEQRDYRGAMAALAVDEHEGCVGRQRTQGRRTDQGRRVGDWFLGDIVGRHQRREQRIHVAVALGQEVVSAYDIHRHRRIVGRTVPAAGSDDEDFFHVLRGLTLIGRLGPGSIGGERCQSCNGDDQGQVKYLFHRISPLIDKRFVLGKL